MVQRMNMGRPDLTVGAKSVPAYRNALDCLLRVWREEGHRGLFAGLSVNLVRGLSGALLLVGYDELKAAFYSLQSGSRSG